MLTEPDKGALVRDYLQALEARDLERCLGFFADDAVIHFAFGVYQGPQAIRDWHQERFNADLHVVKLDKLASREQEATFEVVITSQRLKAWRINTLRGKGKFVFVGDKIREARYSLAGANPLEGWQ